MQVILEQVDELWNENQLVSFPFMVYCGPHPDNAFR
jgi:hypothetical protein